MLKGIDTLLKELHKPLPRYTSYPTAADWYPLSEKEYRNELLKITSPLSLYVHIPFCEKMCLYCGCSVILNRKEEKEALYTEMLIKEMALLSAALSDKKNVVQLHFGGGTPTKLNSILLEKIMDSLHTYFLIDEKEEIAIEVDPRTVYADQGEKLRYLKRLGFNRISFGVQDSNEKVQEATKRRQSWTMTEECVYLAQEIGFKKINIDLIYGLPLQTKESFAETTEKIVQLRPNRIALFSYAQVPWIKPHQKAIKEADLPSLDEKFAIYAAARASFIQNGYLAIGMDHFALPSDELGEAYLQKKMTRNFQGYSTSKAKEVIAFGVSGISSLIGGYFQNSKELTTYQDAIHKGLFPIERGFLLQEEDHIRKEMIQELMCHFKLTKKSQFIPYLLPLREELYALEKKELLIDHEDRIEVTPLGELFIRNIAHLFDQRRALHPHQFSKSI